MRLPIGIQTFEKIRTSDYHYVDKTGHLLELIRANEYYFLSRPRRFGKSLLVDTLRELFSGNEPLFRGLAIHPHWDWADRHPVVLIPFGRGMIESRKRLDEKIRIFLDEIAEEEGLTLAREAPADRFYELIRALCEKHRRRVAILVDEYDKPILDNLLRPGAAREIREGLRDFYAVIKDADRYVRFAFITGVSKFSKVSLFSGLNNLADITLSPGAATLCGYTEAEFRDTFAHHLEGLDLAEVARWYDGYNFLGERVYNPFDALLFLKDRKFRPYWFETATPTFLIRLLEARPYPIPRMESLKASEALLSDFDVDRIHLETLLFQTGYLTIRKAREMAGTTQYELTYPNREVKASLTDVILQHLVSDAREKAEAQLALYELLEKNDLDGLRDLFHRFFAGIPNDWYRRNRLAGYEGYYASVIYCYFAALGLDVTAEDHTNHGRIDLSVRFRDRVYLIEFKVAELADAGNALEQLKAMKYHEKYADRETWLIGVSFSSRDRNVVGFDWEKAETGNFPAGQDKSI